MRNLVLVPAILLLAACQGTVTVFPVEEGATPVIDTSTEGVLVGSSMFSGYLEGDGAFPGSPVDSEDFRCQSYSLLYRGTEAATEAFVGDLSAIPSGGNKSKPEDAYDYDVPKGRGYLSATVLPAGRYELWYRGYYCFQTHYYAHDFTVPFEIVAGSANYFGELQYRHTFDETFLGNVSFDGAIMMIDDTKVERDTELLNTKYPFLETLPVVEIGLEWEKMYERPDDGS